jgi:HSP20 family protein
MAMVYRKYFWHKIEHAIDGVVSIVRSTVPGFGAGGVSDRFLPGVFGGFPIDVSEDEDEIVVVADLPGAGQGDIKIGLLSPNNLCITSTRSSGQSDLCEEGKTVRNERFVGPMHRVVALPRAVTAENGRASFDNGVLEIRLKTVTPERGVRIPIE